ncbi:hypothetical protein EVAR_54787_1 [Eumeta japonica]|uniref:Uncharacterized protein n=1 Tax=Eumeta variegata TaxID=151549 RepID=A0A4C1YD61_EUMVA|nr:hypothetical protein EVAR_54787_1 [Eumeta japonica]
MAPRKKTTLSKEEIAKKKSEQAKRRLEKIKNDPVLLAEYKEKERLKYLKKKEKGQRKCVKDMTPREHRKARKNWVAYSSDHRKKQKIQENTDNCFCDNVDCNDYNLGTITYQTNTQRLQVSDIYTDSEDDMPLASVSHIAQEKSKTSYGSGDYVLVKLIMGEKNTDTPQFAQNMMMMKES